jgi:hypothetical protein
VELFMGIVLTAASFIGRLAALAIARGYRTSLWPWRSRTSRDLVLRTSDTAIFEPPLVGLLLGPDESLVVALLAVAPFV